MRVLLSIKPEYADKIFSGEKKFEFRKRVFKNIEVQTIVVYSTMPVGMIIGEFSIKNIHRDSPKSIWKKTKRFSGVNEHFFYEYYDGIAIAIAIEVDNPILYKEPINPYKEPINLKDKGVKFTAPQSFMYITP